MAVDLVLLPEAHLDIAEAYAWYERRRPGLGEEFLSSVESCFEGIRRHPEMCAAMYETYRRALTRRFPCAIFYGYVDDIVTVYGVLHTARRSDKWRERSS